MAGEELIYRKRGPTLLLANQVKGSGGSRESKSERDRVRERERTTFCNETTIETRPPYDAPASTSVAFHASDRFPRCNQGGDAL